jgi:subtilisin-like proprotein convertase family protein
MKKLAIAGLTMLFVGMSAMSAMAEKVSSQGPPTDPTDSPGQCPTTGYKSVTGTVNLSIPDGSPAGVTTPPLQLAPDGSTILDVVVDLGITHTWIGDLNVQLTYDHDCAAGTPAFGPVSLMCRQQLAGCPVDMCCGCLGDLLAGGRYVFGTNGSTKEIAADAQGCPDAIPFGCYRQATESQFNFSVFSGLRKDGCWRLFLQDGAGLDVGTLQNWKVSVANQQTTAVEAATWGSVKAGYAL